jgi:energy-coupling factor transport system permease protein
MAKMVMGRYLDTSTFYHKIHPLVKIILFSITTIFAIVTSNISTYVIFTFFLLTSIYFSGIGMSTYIKAMKPVLIVFLWTLLFQIIFNRQGNLLYEFYFIKFYDKAIFNGFLVLMRMFVLVSTATILTLSTSPTELTHAFEDFFKPLKYIRIPVDTMALILSIALRFIPLFFDEVERIEIAQKSKGYDVDDLKFFPKFKYYAFLLIPLMLSAVKKAEDTASAMEIRGYGIDRKASRYREYLLGKEDFVLISLYFIIIIIILIF